MSSIVSLGRGQSNDVCLALERWGCIPSIADNIVDNQEVARAMVALAAVPSVFNLDRFRVEIRSEEIFSWEDLITKGYPLRIDQERIKKSSSFELRELFRDERVNPGIYDVLPAIIASNLKRGKLSLYGQNFQEQSRLAHSLFNDNRIIVPNAPTALMILHMLRERSIKIPSVTFRTASCAKVPNPHFIGIEPAQDSWYTLILTPADDSDDFFVYSHPNEDRQSFTLFVVLKIG